MTERGAVRVGSFGRLIVSALTLALAACGDGERAAETPAGVAEFTTIDFANVANYSEPNHAGPFTGVGVGVGAGVGVGEGVGAPPPPPPQATSTAVEVSIPSVARRDVANGGFLETLMRQTLPSAGISRPLP